MHDRAGYMARFEPEFAPRNARIIGLRVDPAFDHARWAKDIEETQRTAVGHPMFGDADVAVAKIYDMIDSGASGGGPRTAVDNQTVRNALLIRPDKKVKAILDHPISAGGNFDEVLRLLNVLQLNAKEWSRRR